jgi:hypothetical protein
MGMAGFQAFEGCHRCGADYASEVLFHHNGKDRPAAIKGSPEAGIDDQIPGLVGNINDLRWPVCAGVIKEDVYFSKSFHRFLDGFLDILPARDVTLHGEGMNATIILYLICHSSAAFEVHIGDDNVCAFPGKHAGSSLPYTGTGCCGAKSNPIFQFHGITSRDILPK